MTTENKCLGQIAESEAQVASGEAGGSVGNQVNVPGTQAIPSEAEHWYYPNGNPCYTIQGSNGKMRPTTLADARKLDLVPSVTKILREAAAPGLEAWKAKQVLVAALTLPKIGGEALDDYATRVMQDAKEQGRKAAERGTFLHAAIEQWIQGKVIDPRWIDHATKVHDAMLQCGINIRQGKSEHSFASPLGYGGKIDIWSHEFGVWDFKSKDRIDDKKKMVFDEHAMQIAAYWQGLNLPMPFRGGNIFVGVEDAEVRIVEHSWEDLRRGWAMFSLLLNFWKIRNDFGRYTL